MVSAASVTKAVASLRALLNLKSVTDSAIKKGLVGIGVAYQSVATQLGVPNPNQASPDASSPQAAHLRFKAVYAETRERTVLALSQLTAFVRANKDLDTSTLVALGVGFKMARDLAPKRRTEAEYETARAAAKAREAQRVAVDERLIAQAQHQRPPREDVSHLTRYLVPRAAGIGSIADVEYVGPPISISQREALMEYQNRVVDANAGGHDRGSTY